jgi:hypothetical protein
MKLREFYESGLTFSIEEIARDEELATNIQIVLIWIHALESTPGGADGKFGPISTAALSEFQTLTRVGTVGTLDKATAKALIETSPEKYEALIPTGVVAPSNDQAGRIIKYMVAKGYNISRQPGTYNIVYVEGVELDGTLNGDGLNSFNDLRLVIQINDMGKPVIVDKWVATTEPGSFWTNNPMNPGGAARIKFGQYKAWNVGAHITKSTNQWPALVQVRNVTVHRDFNQDGFRTGDKLDTGLFGINQHHANDSSRNDIGRWGAGCLVGRTEFGHNQFMDIIMKDKRYKANKEYLFETTIIPGDDLNKMFPI